MMLTFRKFLVPVVLGLIFLIGVSAVYGGGPPLNIHETVRETVTWTIPAGQCPSLPAGLSVSGTGERHAVINTKENSDGSSQIIINDVVKGTAVDSNGDTYRFIYTNHSIQSVPAGGLPIQFEMNDSFVLNGRGAAGNLAVGFVIRWSTTDPNDPTWPPPNVEIVNLRGEAFLCDPI
ncbi:MAG: hypothetical protein K8J31_02845 [Anaerolineae bacterium]|nr:hypothetical protein [Anaerolineae bacterium]